MDDCRKSQTFAATPAEPGDLPWWFRQDSCAKQRLDVAIKRSIAGEDGPGRMVAAEIVSAFD
jgi:hypothetical protein